ncbi:uncharacterized protein BJ171DRAFT_513088 [Polychytrium aggregatum]|uniref:uncharacterized protein n=1 Tax=Polychytrium aggregatum TaxID=110093 RepID=UPI0022FEC4F7|nr:uncharacterized protein BJ171DRAFT_513088 [Polychytrium aggregatum]KAI9202733.1 hypothetical protein BJ171DRAFT_513088 [Polychytrium aggregatum]
MGVFSDIKKAVSVKIFQYELTLGLYMLEPIEKAIFNAILVLFLALMVYAVHHYLPDQASYVMSKTRYYLSAESD